MTSTDDTVEYPYRAVSRAAIASLVFAVLALAGLIPTFSPMLACAAIGIIAALVALRAISRYPDEFSGRPLALFALSANVLLLVGGIGEHTYIYLTEVPEGYERVAFYDLQQDPNLPDRPTDKALAIDGEKVFLKGYIHPSSGSGMLRHFILVPDLGTCCFGGQPRSSDMIEVILKNGERVEAGLMKQKLAGQFKVNRTPQMLSKFDNRMFYQMSVDQIR